MASSQKEGYFDKAELLGRGWTDSLIGRFLGDADREERNRSDPGGPPLQWYWKDRVLTRERDATVERALRRVEQRRARKLATGRRMLERDFSLFKEYFPHARALEQRFVYRKTLPENPTHKGWGFRATIATLALVVSL